MLGIKLVNVRNSGIAFGLLSDGGALLVVGTAVALLALVFFFVTHTGRPLVWLPDRAAAGRRDRQPDRPRRARDR